MERRQCAKRLFCQLLGTLSRGEAHLIELHLRRWLPPEVFVLTCAFNTIEREHDTAQASERQARGASDLAACAGERPGPGQWLRRALRFHGLRSWG